MQLRVLFLARLREVTGMREIMLDVPDGLYAYLWAIQQGGASGSEDEKEWMLA